MQKIKREIKNIVIISMLIVLCLGIWGGLSVAHYTNGVVYADGDSVPPQEKSANIDLKAFKLEDNTGYKESEDKLVSKYSHPLKNNLIKLALYTQSNVSEPIIDAGNIDGYKAFGITGNCAQIHLTYNFDDPTNLYQRSYKDGDLYKTETYSISNDTAQQVGDVERLGVVGTGAVVFQKKLTAGGSWEWQTKDGETKKNLHTVNFTDVVPLSQYGAGDRYVLYTPSGADLSRGVFIKVTFAYEIKVTTSWDYKNWLGIKKTKTETEYINMLETAEFYLVQNSGSVLFRNASTFDKVGDEDGSGAISIDDFETILDGDVTLNGFRIDTLGVDAYEIKYRYNGGEEKKAEDGQFFLNHGRYDFTIKRKFGNAIKHTIFVDRREVNDAVVGYFGQSLFTPDSQRIYTTGEYPTYIAGKATWNLNATDGTVAPVTGKLYKIEDEGEEIFVRDIAQSYGTDYKTNQLQGTIYEVGIYKAEFWGNPRYKGDGSVSGDMYHFTFRFEIVDKDTPKEPSINEAYLNGLLSFSDMQSKYYAVTMPTKGVGNAIFAFSDFGGAYDFVYEIERSKVEKRQDGYIYNGRTYDTQKAVLTAIDEIAKTLISIRYFDSTDPESYQTADVDAEKILEMNYTKDVIVFLNEDEQSYMQAGLPSLNGRKYRYISPETGEIQEGVMEFAFLKVADFESNSVTLTHKTSKNKYEILYGVSVEYQLGMANAPSGVYTVRESNIYGEISEYDAVYIRPREMTGTATVSLFRGGEFIERTFDKDNVFTESGLSGFVLKSLSNDLDTYSIVKINYNGKVSIYSFDEISDMWFSDGGVYDITLADRLGNTVEFSLVISNPVGYVDVYLQLEQEDEEIQTHYHVFVGQKIQLPIPKLASELYVFDGWLYDDQLIENNIFIPDTDGVIYVWQQISQKYTYLSFDSDGGEPIERMKVEIGEPVELPIAVKEGWTFGGWQYGGTVYDGEFIPSSASPTFVAVWNYQVTQIQLYDGNLTETIDAHVGEKVNLPFPTRTGYTFFGWREDEGNNQNKVYYGQITQLANIDYLRLDALWIRHSDEDIDALPSGTGGRTAIHFIDGDLLANDSIQANSGAMISLPNVTRAGFTFVGWIWKISSTSGKIYGDSTMTVSADAGSKLVLQALWIAKGTTNTISTDIDTQNTSAIVSVISSPSQAALGGLVCLLCFIFALCITYTVSKRRYVERSLESCNREDFQDRRLIRQRRIRRYGAVTLLTAFALIILLTFLSAFGGWADMGIFREYASERNVTPVQSQSVQDSVVGNTFELSDNADNATSTDETKPSKEAVLGNIQDSGILDDSGIDLTDEELFLYSLIMIDFYSLGYYVFPVEAVLPNKDRVLGFGYSDYEKCFNAKDTSDDTLYIGSGFVSLPRQPEITDKDVEEGVELLLAYDETDIKDNERPAELEKSSYLISFTESYGPCHYIADGQYVKYSVDKYNVKYTTQKASEEIYDPECGALYDYDLGRIVFDPSLGKSTDIEATSLNTLLDPVIAQNEYNRYIAEQTSNGFTVDTLNFTFISYEAIEAYQLNGQDETFLGLDVQDFYEIEKTLGGNEYYTVDQDGNLTKLEFPRIEDEDKASWLDRLTGFILAVDMILIGVVIVATVGFISCGAGTAAAPYIMGAAIGAAMEVFMQTVVQGKKLNQVNWLRVGIAAVSGVLCAIPGVGWIGAGLIQGATEAAFTAVDGGNLEDVLMSFGTGFIMGVIFHGIGKAVSKMKFCFVAGTAVLMASGTSKAIENIRVGDMVKSYNSVTGKVSNKRVLQTFENETDELVTVTMSDGQQVTSTPGHKFYANNQWLSAEDLRAGDVLVNVNGKKVIVEQVQHEILDSPVKVYNFEVADNHTYFVGDGDGIAVHNDTCYKGINKNTNKPYIGRTNNVTRRMKQHANNKVHPRDMADVEYLPRDLSKDQAKILEETLIKTFENFDDLDNIIHGMSTQNPLYSQIDTVGQELLELFRKFATKL